MASIVSFFFEVRPLTSMHSTMQVEEERYRIPPQWSGCVRGEYRTLWRSACRNLRIRPWCILWESAATTASSCSPPATPRPYMGGQSLFETDWKLTTWNCNYYCIFARREFAGYLIHDSLHGNSSVRFQRSYCIRHAFRLGYIAL